MLERTESAREGGLAHSLQVTYARLTGKRCVPGAGNSWGLLKCMYGQASLARIYRGPNLNAWIWRDHAHPCSLKCRVWRTWSRRSLAPLWQWSTSMKMWPPWTNKLAKRSQGSWMKNPTCLTRSRLCPWNDRGWRGQQKKWKTACQVSRLAGNHNGWKLKHRRFTQKPLNGSDLDSLGKGNTLAKRFPLVWRPYLERSHHQDRQEFTNVVLSVYNVGRITNSVIPHTNTLGNSSLQMRAPGGCWTPRRKSYFWGMGLTTPFLPGRHPKRRETPRVFGCPPFLPGWLFFCLFVCDPGCCLLQTMDSLGPLPTLGFSIGSCTGVSHACPFNCTFG